MDKPERVILTNMCMIQNGSKVLVEDKRSVWADGIVFPGGHVEEHEPIADSVIREIREETGLTIASPQMCGIKEWINEDGSRYIVFLFKTGHFSGELTSSSEGRVFWMEMEEVLKSNWIWNMDGILQIMTGDRYSELFLDTADDWKPVLK